MVEQNYQQVRNRNAISAVFVAIMVGIGYQEWIGCVRSALTTSDNWTFAGLVYPSVFVLTSLRFFMGNQLHLISHTHSGVSPRIWFLDFCFIFAEALIIAAMGTVSSVRASMAMMVSLADWLTLLCVVDMVWILTQEAMRNLPGWKRDRVPTPWLWLNLGLLGFLLIIRFAAGGQHSEMAVYLFGLTNLIAFIVDVFLIDHYNLFWRMAAGVPAEDAIEPPAELAADVL